MRFYPVSSGQMNSSASRSHRSISSRAALLIALTAAFMTALTLSAAAQAVKTGSTPPPEPSRYDLYGGYGYFHPFSGQIGNTNYQPINAGAVVSATGYFDRTLGLQV